MLAAVSVFSRRRQDGLASGGLGLGMVDATRRWDDDAADVRAVVPGAVQEVLRTDRSATRKLQTRPRVHWHCWILLLHCALASCGAVYCNRSCLWRTGERADDGRGGGVSYPDNSKLRASIFTKLGLQVKVVTISSWLNFSRPAPPGRGSAAGRIFLAAPYYSQRAVFASLWALFSFVVCFCCRRRFVVVAALPPPHYYYCCIYSIHY